MWVKTVRVEIKIIEMNIQLNIACCVDISCEHKQCGQTVEVRAYA
jgi:hypothetical protein